MKMRISSDGTRSVSAYSTVRCLTDWVFTFDTSDNPPENLSNVEGEYRENWTGFIEADFDLNDIKRLASEAVETSKAIHRGVFDQTLSPSTVRCAPMSQFVKNDKPKSRETQLKEA